MTDLELVDQMEQTRTKNNFAWMTILRIALESDPVRTKRVIREIAQWDNEIHDLWQQLADD